MKSTIEELRLLLMYLTSWKEGKRTDEKIYNRGIDYGYKQF